MKNFVRLVLLTLLPIAGLAITLYFLLPGATQTAVQRGSKAALGVEASIESLPFSLSASSARVGMIGLTIPNPTGFGATPFLSVGHASVELDTFSVLQDVIRVREIRLEGTRLHLIQKGSASNLHWFLKRIPTNGSDADEDSSMADPQEDSTLLAVDRVVISGLTAALTLEDLPLGVGSWEVTLPPLDLDLSSAEPGNSGDLMRVILREIVADSVEGLTAQLPPQARQVLQQGDIQDLLKDMLSQGLETDEKGILEKLTGQKTRDAVDEVLRQLPQSKDLKGFGGLLPD